MVYGVNNKIAFFANWYTTAKMAMDNSVPVRFDDPAINRLDRAARKLGINRANVIRVCIETFLDFFEENGHAALPPNWLELLRSYDSRSKGGGSVSYGAAELNDKAQKQINSEPAVADAKAAEPSLDELRRIEESRRKREAGGPSARKRKPKRGGGKGS